VVHLASVAGHRGKVQPRLAAANEHAFRCKQRPRLPRQSFLISEFDELTKNT
jgi:hypothetical protein